MNTQTLRTASIALMISLNMVSAHAASSATSSASESASSTAGSASDSVKGSSNSSSKGTGMAAGEYQLIQVAQSTDRPGMVTMKLACVGHAATDREVEVMLPKTAFEHGALEIGGIVAVREKSYGLELANGNTQQAFFLVLANDWHRELGIKPVVL